MERTQSGRNPIIYYFLSLIGYFILYIASNFLLFVIILCFVFVVISVINFTGGDLSLIGIDKIERLYKLLGLKKNPVINERDIINFYLRLSFVFTLIGIFSSKFWSILTKRDLTVSFGQRLKIGAVVITLLMLMAQVSPLFPNAAKGAEKLWPLILFFWYWICQRILFIFH